MIAACVLALALVGPRSYDGPTEVARPIDGVIAPAAIAPPRPVPTAATAPAPPRRSRSTPAFGRVRARWALDATITVGAGVPLLVLNRWVAPQLPLQPLPSEPPDLGRADALAHGQFAPRVATATDVMVAVAMAAGPLVALVDGHWAARAASDHRRRAFLTKWGTAVLVEAEALALTGLVTSIMKYAVGRPRPYTSLGEADVPARNRDELAHELQAADRSRSFPSGHSSMAFAAATSLATILTLDAPPTRRGKLVVALAWSIGLLTAGTTAALRVVAGKHYPSDILAGSAIGAAIGVATPLLHTRRPLGRRR